MPLSSYSRNWSAGPRGMVARKPPERYWRSYGTDPLPSGAEALDEPFSAFPSWLLRATCDRCGKDRMFAETHFDKRDLPIRETSSECAMMGAEDVWATRNW